MSSKDKRKKKKAERPDFAELFHDSLAGKAEWDAMEDEGSERATYYLAENRSYADRMEFKPTKFNILGIFVCYLFGFGALALFSWILFRGGGHYSFYNISSVVLCVFLCVIILWVMPLTGDKMFFDLDRGYYWTGSKKLGEVTPEEDADSETLPLKLDMIHAIQLLAKHCFSSKESYMSYEINLVTNDGGRFNVVDHGELELIRKDSKALGEFLHVPVWDSIDHFVLECEFTESSESYDGTGDYSDGDYDGDGDGD